MTNLLLAIYSLGDEILAIIIALWQYTHIVETRILRTLVFQTVAILVMPMIWGIDGIWFSVVIAG